MLRVQVRRVIVPVIGVDGSGLESLWRKISFLNRERWWDVGDTETA